MVTKKASMIPNFLISRKPPSVNEIIKSPKITDFEPLQKNKKNKENKENNGDWTVYKGKKTNLNYGGKKRYANPVRKPNVKKESGLNIKGNIGGRKKKDKKTGAKFTTDDLNISVNARYKGLGLGGTFTQSKSVSSPTDRRIKDEFRNKLVELRKEVPVNKNISLYGKVKREKGKFKYNDPFYRTSGSSKPQYGYTLGATYGNPDDYSIKVEGSGIPGQPSIGRKRELGARIRANLRFNKGGSVRGRKANYGR